MKLLLSGYRESTKKMSFWDQEPRSPQFPLRVIFDDGQLLELSSPEELLDKVLGIDSTDPKERIWVRDALDRTIRLRIRYGMVELFEVE